MKGRLTPKVLSPCDATSQAPVICPTAFCPVRRADYNQLAGGQIDGPVSETRLNLVMSIFWLRVALAFYGVGLLYALVALTRTSDLLNRIALHAAYLGMVFHFVSLTEGVLFSGHITLAWCTTRSRCWPS